MNKAFKRLSEREREREREKDRERERDRETHTHKLSVNKHNWLSNFILFNHYLIFPRNIGIKPHCYWK